MMVFIFVIPKDQFYALGFAILLLPDGDSFNQVPLIKYIKSLKQIAYLLIFSFFFQALFNKSGETFPPIAQNLSIANIAIGVVLLALYLVFRKHLPFKLLWLLLIIVAIIYIFQYPLIGKTIKPYQLVIYKGGVVTGFFIIVRIMLLIVYSSILTLTTKPTDLTTLWNG